MEKFIGVDVEISWKTRKEARRGFDLLDALANGDGRDPELLALADAGRIFLPPDCVYDIDEVTHYTTTHKVGLTISGNNRDAADSQARVVLDVARAAGECRATFDFLVPDVVEVGFGAANPF
jgi:hypothetical protein